MIVHLSQHEHQMLMSTVQLAEPLQAVVRSARSAGAVWQLELSTSQAEQIRDCCGSTLAQIGFDEHYEPNQEGLVLEALIDRFFPHPTPAA